MNNIKVCEICGRTSKEICVGKYKDMMLCSKHKSQFFRHGKFSDDTIYAPNEYILYDDYAEIILKDKHCNEVGRALIDLEDVEKCKKYKWHIRKEKRNLYAKSHDKDDPNKTVHLHHFVLNYDGDKEIDHINHNGLDNRKKNLRETSHQTNMRNQRNGRNGVRKTPNGKYQIILTHNYKPMYLGTFDTYEEACELRNKISDLLYECEKCADSPYNDSDCYYLKALELIKPKLRKNLYNQYAEKIS